MNIQAVHYRLTLAPEAHEYQVQITITQPDPQGQTLRLPAWVPGSYLIRDFAKHLISLSAYGAGQPVRVTKQDKHTWVCAPCAGPLEISYRIYAFDKSVRGAYLDMRQGFFDGAALFLQAVGAATEPCHLELLPHLPLTHWQIATAMQPSTVDTAGFGRYQAADYAELIDHPFLLGTLERRTFNAGGMLHQLVVQGRHYGDLARLTQDLARICEAEISLFGGSPVQHYVFLLRVVDEGYGGLEHRNSCHLLASREDLPRVGMETPTPGYRRLLGLFSHEYFHTWWVKSLKPQCFQPYDLCRETYTELLWVFEGITSYYDDLILLRAKLISLESYLELLAQNITRLWRNPGRQVQCLAESSFDAWIKFYQPNENTGNTQVSYYLKGGLVALLLDLTLRQRSQGLRTLDELVRQLWQTCGQAGLSETDFEVKASLYAGFDLSGFFAQALRSTAELDIAAALAQVGVQVHARPAASLADGGGYLAQPELLAKPPRATMGASWNPQAVEAVLTVVVHGGAAQQAGLSPGDVLVAVEGLRITGRNLEARLNAYAPGNPLRLHYFHRDELQVATVYLAAAASDTCYLSLSRPLPSQQQAQQQAWAQPS